MNAVLKQTGNLPLTAKQEDPEPYSPTPLQPKKTVRKSKEQKQKDGEPIIPE